LQKTPRLPYKDRPRCSGKFVFVVTITRNGRILSYAQYFNG